MSNYTAEDVRLALREAYAAQDGYESIDDFSDSEMWSEYSWGSTQPFVAPGIDGTIEVVESAGGEGQGDHAHIVFKVVTVDGDEQFFKIDGYYSSYDGTDWDYADLRKVRPVERVVTFYE